ncbi:unnamed protein product [Lepidochelys kempii]
MCQLDWKILQKNIIFVDEFHSAINREDCNAVLVKRAVTGGKKSDLFGWLELKIALQKQLK